MLKLTLAIEKDPELLQKYGLALALYAGAEEMLGQLLRIALAKNEITSTEDPLEKNFRKKD